MLEQKNRGQAERAPLPAQTQGGRTPTGAADLQLAPFISNLVRV